MSEGTWNQVQFGTATVGVIIGGGIRPMRLDIIGIRLPLLFPTHGGLQGRFGSG
jgi:hypothetical protein